LLISVTIQEKQSKYSEIPSVDPAEALADDLAGVGDQKEGFRVMLLDIAAQLDGLVAVIANAEKIMTLREQQLYFDAGVVLVLVPVVIIYLILQRSFIEGVERSGIVG
jgi:hypothetical protein